MKKTLFTFTLTAVCLIMVSSLAAQTRGKLDNPNASPEAVKLYDYLLDLTQSQSQEGKLIVGHWLGGSFRPNTSDYPFTMGEVTELRRHSGKWIGMIDAWVCNGEFGLKNAYDPLGDCMWYDQMVTDYKLWWNNGGICHVDASYYAPLEDGYWHRFEKKVTKEVDYDALFTPGTEVNKRFWALNERMADFFLALQADDVPVIFRPFTEGYIDVFWYSAKRMGPQRSIELWRQVHDYFTKTRGCDNIIWDFQGDRDYAHYPGDAYVDLLTTRSEYLANQNAFGRCLNPGSGMPVGNGELGDYGDSPRIADASKHRPWSDWLEHTKKNCPEMSFYITWDRQWGPVQHKNKETFIYGKYHKEYDAMMNDPYVITRDKITVTPKAPALPYRSDFKANEKLITFRGDWQTGSGVLTRKDTQGESMALLGGTDWTDYTVRTAFTFTGTGTQALLGRCVSVNIFVAADLADGKLNLWRCFEGRRTELGSIPFAPVKGKPVELSLTFKGDSIVAAASAKGVKSVQVKASDDAIPSGCTGIRTVDSSASCSLVEATVK